MSSNQQTIVIRRATPEDTEPILSLASDALGWDNQGPHRRLFEWKHFDNPFGASPMWVAEVDGDMAGFRTFLRWEYLSTFSVEPICAVRAVDTATHPNFQGRGIFRELTLGALEEVRGEGVSFVFNTPNDQSRPGYLKMGWIEMGRVPVGFRARGPASLARMARAREPAQKWSLACDVGVDAVGFFATDPAVLTERRATLETNRTPDFLKWRYGLADLHYRCVTCSENPADGVVVFRLRKRGSATEAVIADWFAPRPSVARGLIKKVLKTTGAEYAIAVAPPTLAAQLGLVPLPSQGPRLTWRKVNQSEAPKLGDFGLRMGDVELF